MDISNYIDSALLAVITAVIGIAVKYAVSFLKQKGLSDIAYKAVSAAEGIFTDVGKGTDKYAYAANFIVAEVEKIGIKLDANRVKVLIESALVTLKSDLGVALKPTEVKAAADDQPAAPTAQAQTAAEAPKA